MLAYSTFTVFMWNLARRWDWIFFYDCNNIGIYQKFHKTFAFQQQATYVGEACNITYDTHPMCAVHIQNDTFTENSNLL